MQTLDSCFWSENLNQAAANQNEEIFTEKVKADLVFSCDEEDRWRNVL